MSTRLSSAALSLSLASFLVPASPSATAAQVGAPPPASQAAGAEKLGPDLYRIGPVRVNTRSREVSVAGTVNTVTVLEFAANAKGGMKAYESALTLDTDAINFNAALALIGLDRKNAKISPAHFDPAIVTGDPVDVSVEWKTADGRTERAPLDRLIVDKSSSQPIVDNKWVYTGSTFWADGRYAAAVEGVLIGFAHTPNSIIESAKGIGLGRYGSIILNPALNLAPGTAVTVTIKALQPASKN